ncbi:MAG: CoA pyrophosphatase [Chloroflexi bacterium]|nr:MAG: CoA pyrophosphatase [Chloroflexota bacterium]TME45131.1 MAG: CoA pyrophosphatase [Chloroflexota bacterium]
MQAHAPLATHQWPRSAGAARGWPAGDPPRTGLGLHALRAPGAGVLRGMDVTRLPATRANTDIGRRLERLQQHLHRRVRRGIEVAPPLLRAGVLVPLLIGHDGPELLFTRRTETVLTHKGQISFPGGQREDVDLETIETALRESYEEIGLDTSRVTVLGELDDVFTSVSAFVITPVVGVVAGGTDKLRPAPDEVKSLLVVPLSTLDGPGVHTTETRRVDDQRYRIHYYRVGDDIIWGATGRIVYQFLQAWQETA